MTRQALVTGGSSGIGRAVAEELVRRGDSVIVASRSAEALEDTVALLERVKTCGDQHVSWLQLDVASEDSVRAGIAVALERLPNLDLLIHSAGVCSRAPRTRSRTSTGTPRCR